MLANGKVQLYDEFGLAGEFNVTLQAEPPGSVGGALMWLAEPANNVQLISVLMAFWVISSGRKGGGERPNAMPIRRPSEQIMAKPMPEYIDSDEFGNLRQF